MADVNPEHTNTLEDENTDAMEDERISTLEGSTCCTQEDEKMDTPEEEKMTEVCSKQSLNELSCVVCTDVYKQPQLLHCMHTFCSHCIQQLTSKQDGRLTVICPVCRFVTKVWVEIISFISFVFNFC